MSASATPSSSNSGSGRARVLPSSAYFKDGVRLVDLVLVFEDDDDRQAAALRQQFELLLKSEGLELEYESSTCHRSEQTVYIKLHATFDALAREAEARCYKFPIMESDLPEPAGDVLTRVCRRLGCANPCALQPHLTLPCKRYFTERFKRQDLASFITLNRQQQLPSPFTVAERGALIWSIVSNANLQIPGHRKKTTQSANLGYLLQRKIYLRAFPIHDADSHAEPSMLKRLPAARWPLRQYLSESWARPRQWLRYQPIHQIKDYFGEKMGLYYAWLGLYTQCLILPALLGTLLVAGNGIFGPMDEIVDFFCDAASNATLFCRDCASVACPFKHPASLCTQARLSHLFDNFGGTVFSVLMAVWSVTFVQLWARKQTELCSQWSTDVEQHKYELKQVRAEYSARVSSSKFNYVTREEQPHLSHRSARRRLLASSATVVFFVCVVLALLLAVGVYRQVGYDWWDFALENTDTDSGYVDYYINPSLVVSLTSSLANGLCIIIMDRVYTRVAYALTRFEYCRTDQRFEHSYTYKVVIFQFINFYGALFYLVLIKPVFTGHPLERGVTNRCPPTGCLLDVSIQLFVVMTGKQALNSVLELARPLASNCWSRRWRNRHTHQHMPRWQKDDQLADVDDPQLFDDYLEMLLQYGFVCMFNAALPLAPAFALINNVMEIRLDAYKHLKQTKKCIPVRTNHVKPWLHLLKVFTKIGVITNACVIAFTSSFVDYMVYTSMQGFYNQFQPFKTYESFMQFATVELNTEYLCTQEERESWRAQEYNRTWLWSLMDFDQVLHNSVNEQQRQSTIDLIERLLVTPTLWYQLPLAEINITHLDFYSRFYKPIETCSRGVRMYVYDEDEGHELVHTCLIRDYRNTANYNYTHSHAWYHVWMGRLAFVLVFVLFVQLVQWLIQLLIPSQTAYVKMHERRQHHLRTQQLRTRRDTTYPSSRNNNCRSLQMSVTPDTQSSALSQCDDTEPLLPPTLSAQSTPSLKPKPTTVVSQHNESPRPTGRPTRLNRLNLISAAAGTAKPDASSARPASLAMLDTRRQQLQQQQLQPASKRQSVPVSMPAAGRPFNILSHAAGNLSDVPSAKSIEVPLSMPLLSRQQSARLQPLQQAATATSSSSNGSDRSWLLYQTHNNTSNTSVVPATATAPKPTAVLVNGVSSPSHSSSSHIPVSRHLTSSSSSSVSRGSTPSPRLGNRSTKNVSSSSRQQVPAAIADVQVVQSGHILYENADGTYSSYETLEFINEFEQREASAKRDALLQRRAAIPTVEEEDTTAAGSDTTLTDGEHEDGTSTDDQAVAKKPSLRGSLASGRCASSSLNLSTRPTLASAATSRSALSLNKLHIVNDRTTSKWRSQEVMSELLAKQNASIRLNNLKAEIQLIHKRLPKT